jgi:hypothetical protein
LSLRARLTVATAAAVAVLAIASQPSAQRRLRRRSRPPRRRTRHVFTVGPLLLLDEGSVNPVTAAASTMTLTAEAARYAARAAVTSSPCQPWQLASSRELPYLPEQPL